MNKLLDKSKYLLNQKDIIEIEICENIIIDYKNTRIERKKNLIKIIEIIRINKFLFKLSDVLELYNNLLKYLYKKLDYLIDIRSKYYKENYKEINSTINSIDKLNKSEYVEYILENINGLEILLWYYNNIEFEFLNEPIPKKYELKQIPMLDFTNKKDDQIIISSIKLLLGLFTDLLSKQIKRIMVIIIFDYIFRNFYFLENNLKFAITVKNKLEELYKIDEDQENFKNILNTYYNDINSMDIWINYLNNYLNNKDSSIVNI